MSQNLYKQNTGMKLYKTNKQSSSIQRSQNNEDRSVHSKINKKSLGKHIQHPQQQLNIPLSLSQFAMLRENIQDTHHRNHLYM